MKTDSLKILLVQPQTFLGDIDANLKNIDNLISNSKQKPNLVILPEMFSTGFSMRPEQYAETTNGKALNWLINKAKTSNTAIVGSIMIEEDNKYFNRAFFVFPNGEYKSYNKRHLFSFVGEDKKYEAGNSKLIVEYLGWKICPLVCYDLRFPVWSRNKNEYDLLIYISSWPEARHKVWSILPTARAIENQSYVATSNRVGSDKTGVYLGESKVINALGETIAESNLNKEETVYCEISLSELIAIREKFPFAGDADNFEII